MTAKGLLQDNCQRLITTNKQLRMITEWLLTYWLLLNKYHKSSLPSDCHRWLQQSIAMNDCYRLTTAEDCHGLITTENCNGVNATTNYYSLMAKKWLSPTITTDSCHRWVPQSNCNKWLLQINHHKRIATGWLQTTKTHPNIT